jgi:GDP-L-fucose synthase
MDKNSVILVTGGTGFLGSALMSKLLDAGYKRISAFPSKSFDLTNPLQAEMLFNSAKPDVVIHLAARVGGIGANMANPATFSMQNLAMGMNVIQMSHKYEVKKLVLAGTICAYPKFTPVPFREKDLWSGYPEETNAPYGLAKKMLLVIAQAYRKQHGLSFCYLLPVNLYGPGDNFDPESSHVIPAMMKKFHDAKKSGADRVTLWGDGAPTREFLYVDDCAEAFVAAMERYDGDDPVNVGSGHEMTMSLLAGIISDVVGYRGRIVWDATKPNGQPRRCLDVTRAKEWLGWQAKTPFSEGILKTYNWFTKNNPA